LFNFSDFELQNNIKENFIADVIYIEEEEEGEDNTRRNFAVRKKAPK